MTTHVEEPPLLRGGGGQAREWANVALLIAEALRARRERDGKTAYSDATQAERDFLANLERAQQPIPARPVHATERGAHLAPGTEWRVGGRAAGAAGSAVSTEISQVGERWVLHAVGHPPGGGPDVDAWLSCSSWTIASHLATNLLRHNEPDRVERLRDHADFADRLRETRRAADEAGEQNYEDVGARARRGRENGPADRRSQETNDGVGPTTAYEDVGRRARRRREDASADRWSRETNGGVNSSTAEEDSPGNDRRPPRREVNKAAMREELEAVWPRGTVNAVVNGRAWPYFAKLMDDSQRDGHNLAALLQSMEFSALTRPHVKHPAALAAKLFEKEVKAAEARRDDEHIVVLVPRQEDIEDTTRPTDHQEDLSEDPPVVVESDAQRRSRDQDAAAAWAADDHPVDPSMILEWIAQLDGDAYIDRIAADEVRGSYGAAVDRALAEKFPGILGGPAPAPPDLGDEAQWSRVGGTAQQDLDEASQWSAQAKTWRSRAADDDERAAAARPTHVTTEPESGEVLEPEDAPRLVEPHDEASLPGVVEPGVEGVDEPGASDAHDAAVERANAAEAEGLEDAAVARAQVSATPPSREQRRPGGAPPAATGARSPRTGGAKVPGPRSTPASPGQRPSRSR